MVQFLGVFIHSRKSIYPWIILAFSVVILAGTVAAFLERTSHQRKEFLVIWGQVATRPGEAWHECRLWLFDPETQQSSSPIIQEDRWCGYAVTHVDGKQWLREITPEGQIILYNITSQQTIEVWQTIDLEGQFIRSSPQWGPGDSIYFSALENNQEQIFRFDIQTGTTSSFILFEPGIAADPLISPDGNYLVYWTLEGPINRFPRECGLGCVGYYHIYNLQTHADVELLPLLGPLVKEPYMPHCSAQWAPTGRYLAFNVGGCGDWGPRELIIFDAQENRMEAFFESGAEDLKYTLEGWLSNTEIVYQQVQYSQELGYWAPSYWVYSLEQKTSRELVESPADSEQLSLGLDWTPDSRFILGSIYTTTPPTLMIIDASQEHQHIDYFSYEDEFSNKQRWVPFVSPQFSPSGEWIAYHTSFRDQQEGDDYLDYFRNVYIVNRVTKEVINLNTTNIERNLNYVWMQGQ